MQTQSPIQKIPCVKAIYYTGRFYFNCTQNPYQCSATWYLIIMRRPWLPARHRHLLVTVRAHAHHFLPPNRTLQGSQYLSAALSVPPGHVPGSRPVQSPRASLRRYPSHNPISSRDVLLYNEPKKTHIIFIRVHGLCIKSHGVLSRFCIVADMLTDPDVPVQTEHEIHATRKRAEVGF